MEVRTLQTAYDTEAGADRDGSLSELTYQTMYKYLREDLGLPEPVAEQRAQVEVSGQIGRDTCDEYERAGISFAGKRVLDLGAGLGAFSEEIARRGGNVIALEPGTSWRKVAGSRLAATGRGGAVGAVGEELPIASNSMDLIVSRQVLEHVRNPRQVIAEAYRVLKPGGTFCFTYENYLGFWEPHYRVRWLPLLPKPIGAAYLKSLGRNPQFLLEAVTYTTYPAVRRALAAAGFACNRDAQYRQALHSPEKSSLKWRVLKAVARMSERLAVWLLGLQDDLRKVCRTGIQELVYKPARLER